MCFTSQAIVCDNGSWYSGCLVFINMRKLWSFTIANGCLLSTTHLMISILDLSLVSEEFLLFLTKVCNHSTWFQCRNADNVNKKPFLYRCAQRHLWCSHFSSNLTWPKWCMLHPSPWYCLWHWLLLHPSTSLHANANHLLTLHHQYPGSTAHHDHAFPCSGRLCIQRHGPDSWICIWYEECVWRTCRSEISNLLQGNLDIAGE